MSKSTFGLRRAGLATLAVTLTLGGAFVAAPAQADWAQAAGEIGIVDVDKSTPDTQGATLVYPGVSGQRLADVRLLIPNSFQNGDTIDIAIFDRTATATSPGQINADAAHKLGFTAVPKVTVDQKPVDASTSIGPGSGSANNTEGTSANAPQPAATPGQASTPPVFKTSLVQSSRANGLANDMIRLTIDGVQASGRNTDEWIVTLSDIVADLGPAVSPGVLRLVPFAYNGAPSTTGTNVSSMFDGNLNDPAEPAGSQQVYNPAINLYTVPAYVAPVTFNVGAPNNVLADGTAQRVGDLTIEETNGYSLQNGTYTISINGAQLENSSASSLTVTKSGGGANETVTAVTVDQTADTISFNLNNTDSASKVTVKVAGLLLSDSTQGPISYELTGGSVDGFMHEYAGTGGAVGPVAPEAAFSTGVNQQDIVAPDFVVDAVSTPLEDRIGGGDRYETAAKIALNNGSNDYVVLASGENFPDALSSGYLANRIGGGSILLTKRDSLPQPTLSAMRELGTRTVFVVGGDAAVSEKVVNQLRNTPQYYAGGRETIGQGKLHVVRLAGDNRYETNKKVNEYAAAWFEGDNPVGRTHITYGESSKLTAIVATGEKFADALAAGPATKGVFEWYGNVYGNLPLILTRSGSLDPAASSQMKNLGIEQAVVVGGEDVVTKAVASSIEGLGADVYRIAGDDRYETATKVADWITADPRPTSTTVGGLGFDEDADGWEGAYLATGEKFADALAGAPLAGGSGSPLLLTRSAGLSAVTEAWLKDNAAEYGWVTALGLGSAVSSSTLDTANAAISAK